MTINCIYWQEYCLVLFKAYKLCSTTSSYFWPTDNFNFLLSKVTSVWTHTNPLSPKRAVTTYAWFHQTGAQSCQLRAVGLQGNKATPHILWTYIKSYISCVLNRLFTLSYPSELLLCTDVVINTGILLRIEFNYGLMFKTCFKLFHFQYISQTLLIYSNYGLPQFLHGRVCVKQYTIFFSRIRRILEF